jgi:hypothetical protein
MPNWHKRPAVLPVNICLRAIAAQAQPSRRVVLNNIAGRDGRSTDQLPVSADWIVGGRRIVFEEAAGPCTTSPTRRPAGQLVPRYVPSAGEPARSSGGGEGGEGWQGVCEGPGGRGRRCWCCIHDALNWCCAARVRWMEWERRCWLPVEVYNFTRNQTVPLQLEETVAETSIAAVAASTPKVTCEVTWRTRWVVAGECSRPVICWAGLGVTGLPAPVDGWMGGCGCVLSALVGEFYPPTLRAQTLRGATVELPSPSARHSSWNWSLGPSIVSTICARSRLSQSAALFAGAGCQRHHPVLSLEETGPPPLPPRLSPCLPPFPSLLRGDLTPSLVR